MILAGPFLANVLRQAGYPAERLVSRAMAARRRSEGQGGFQLVELIIIMAIIGLLAAISVPFVVSYLQAAKLKGSAETVAAWLNQGRQLAIRYNHNICADVHGAGMHYHMRSCADPELWKGAGTDSAGYVPLPAGMTLSMTAPAVFTYLGAATPAATYTITHAGRTITVSVATTGRITIP
jgi:Tfp pilus assembly protein FimT